MSGSHSPMTGPCWEKVSPTARSLVKQLLETDPSLRPSAQHVLTHPWLQGEVVSRARGVMGLPEGNPEGEGVHRARRVMGQLKEEGPQGAAGDTKKRKTEGKDVVTMLKQQRISGWLRA